MSKNFKVRFLFTTEATTTNSKTTVIRVKQMQLHRDDEPFIFAQELQELSHHEELMKTETGKTVKHTLSIQLLRHHKSLFPWITLDKNVATFTGIYYNLMSKYNTNEHVLP